MLSNTNLDSALTRRSSLVNLWLLLFLTLHCCVLLETKLAWSDKQLFPSHKIPDNALNPSRQIVKRKITMYHNFFRTKVQPTSSNMLLMSWHEGAARQAQEYAEQCKFLVHNDNKERNVTNLGSCGQNLFSSSVKTPWFFAIKSWFLEYKLYNYGQPVEDYHKIGHYTQMVWATSHKVGCGLAHCQGGPWGQFYNFVCHYCPGGNQNFEYPYKSGKPCGDCKGHCSVGKLCTNYCPVVDHWSNCNELVKLPNACKDGLCNATCLCGDKRIHKIYPWK